MRYENVLMDASHLEYEVRRLTQAATDHASESTIMAIALAIQQVAASIVATCQKGEA